MTDPDPNETARMPTPGAAGEPATEGWPGSTGAEATTPEALIRDDAALAAQAAGGPPPADPGPTAAEPPPPAVAAPPTPAPAATGWVPPPTPAAVRRRSEPDTGRAASIVFGLILLAIGLWFFAEHTLGLDLPQIRWSQLWPVFIIGLGVWIVLGSMRRGSR